MILLQAALSVVGYEAIHTFEKYAAIGLAILFAIVTIALVPKANFSLAGEAESIGIFILATTIVGSFNLAWALYASDYARYLPSSTPGSRVGAWTFAGLFLSATWIEVLGLAVVGALGTETDTVHQIYGLLGGGIVGVIAMVAIFFGTVAVNAMNDYTGSLSLQAAGIRIPRPISAAIVAVLSFLATLYLYANDFSGRADTINFDEQDVYETLQGMTSGRGPDRCIDAVGAEAHGTGAVDAVLDKVKAMTGG